MGLAVDIAFAEEAACEHFGASSAIVAVVATSSCQLGDGAGTIGKFILDVDAELVVMLDNGPVAGVTRSLAHAIDRCAQEVSDWVACRGRSMVLQVMYADESLAVPRVKHTGCRLFRFVLHRQQQFEHRDNARNIKLCGAGCDDHSRFGSVCPRWRRPLSVCYWWLRPRRLRTVRPVANRCTVRHADPKLCFVQNVVWATSVFRMVRPPCFMN